VWAWNTPAEGDMKSGVLLAAEADAVGPAGSSWDAWAGEKGGGRWAVEVRAWLSGRRSGS